MIPIAFSNPSIPTGLALTGVTKIRNLLIMELDHRTQTRLYEKRWNPTEKNVEYRTSWFIRLFLVAHTGTMPTQSEVFDRFKGNLNRQHRLPRGRHCLPRCQPLLGDVALPLSWRQRSTM